MLPTVFTRSGFYRLTRDVECSAGVLLREGTEMEIVRRDDPSGHFNITAERGVARLPLAFGLDEVWTYADGANGFCAAVISALEPVVDTDPTLAPELLSLPTEVQMSEALLRLLDLEVWIEAQNSPFLADAAAHVSQAHHEITIYRRMTAPRT